VILDLNGRIGIDWGVYGIPETFIVNSKGIIKYRHLGPINSDFYDAFYLKFLTK
jgi:cytochrome c biogenesis protein CcmG/thiol:disulfide interchange protein DsbE